MEFDKIGQIIFKVYSLDCKVGRDKQQPVIIIINDKYTFSSKNDSCFGYQKDGDTFLQPKRKG